MRVPTINFILLFLLNQVVCQLVNAALLGVKQLNVAKIGSMYHLAVKRRHFSLRYVVAQTWNHVLEMKTHRASKHVRWRIDHRVNQYRYLFSSRVQQNGKMTEHCQQIQRPSTPQILCIARILRTNLHSQG